MFGRKDGFDASRRSNDLSGVPAGGQLPLRPSPQPLPVQQAAPTPRNPIEIDEGSPISLFYWIGFAVAGLFGTLVIEGMFSSTSLITPIDAGFLFWMRCIGGLLGLICWGLLILGAGILGSLRITIAALICLPLFGGWIFNGIAWRLSDVWEFGFSTAPFQEARYPITWMSEGRKGRRDTLEIDPFGAGSLDIAVPETQYQWLWRDYHGKCVTVLQRRSASGAIEVKTDGVYTLFEPARVKVSPCDGSEPGAE